MKNLYGIIQGRTFAYSLFKFTCSLAFLCKLSGLLITSEKKRVWSFDSEGCASQTSVLPLVTALCLCLHPEATLHGYLVTPASLIDQDFFPAVRIILSTALGSHHPSELACKMEQTHVCWLSILVNTSLSQESFPSSGLPLWLHALGRWLMILLIHLTKAE